MKYNNKKNKLVIEKYSQGEVVVLSEGMHYYWSEWASKNGRASGTGLYFQNKVEGKYIKQSPESGFLYGIVEVDGELFEVFHKNMNKKVV